MTTFDETNGVIRETDTPVGLRFYAACSATGCTWVGELRSSPSAAKRDAVRHHNAS